MRAEIAQQPEVFARLLADSAPIRDVARAVLARRPRFALIAARGSSDHAALYAKYLIETQLGLPSGLASMSSLTAYGLPRGAERSMEGVLWLAISQSGGSPDLLEATRLAQEAGAITVAVTNAGGSPVAQAAEFHVDMGAGQERSVAATKTYTASLLTLWLLVDALGGQSGQRAYELVDAAAATLDATAVSPVLSALVESLADRDRLVTLGRGFSYPTAREGALELMETTYLAAGAFSGADLLHGPVAHVGAGTPVLAVAPGGVGSDLLRPVLSVLADRGADVTLVGDTSLRGAGDGAGLAAVSVAEDLSSIVQILPLQLLALELSLRRGIDPDAPTGLRRVTRTL